MDNLNSPPKGTVSVDKLFHLHDITDLESELFDAILSSSIFLFTDFCKSYVKRKYTEEQICNALQTLINKKFLSYDSQFRNIKLHIQSVFPYSTPQISDQWLS